MGSQFEQKYRTRLGDELNDEYFNRRWRDVDQRLVALEDAINNLDAAREQLVQLGLVQLNSQIDAAIESLQDLINGANADLTATQAQITTLNGQLTALAAAVAAIISGGTLPATGVTVAAIPGLAGSNVQTALAELQADIDATVALVNGLQFGSIVVANVAARNALTGLVKGDVVFVQDDGAGKWAHYQITSDGDGTWGGANKTLVALQDAYLPLSGGTMQGALNAANIVAVAHGGAEGGEIVMQKPPAGSSLAGDIIVDIAANSWRVFEAGGTFRGIRVDLTATQGGQSSLWHSGNFDPNTKANKAGDTFTGDIAISKTAGNWRGVVFRAATLPRWAVGANQTPEGGGNSGADFVIDRYSDAGGYINTPLVINRQSGNAFFAGQVQAASYNTTSDKRLKTAIKGFALKHCRKVLDLAPVSFRFKRKKTTEIGLIAQDVAEQLPQAVHADEKGMLSINYGAVVAALIGVVKDQEARIAALEAALAAR